LNSDNDYPLSAPDYLQGQVMTELELVEAANSYFELGVEVLGFYMTVTSGFLIAAYLVGDKLTRSQMVTISTLYIFMAVVSTYAAFAYISRGVHYALLLKDLESAGRIYASPFFPALITTILATGILASLRFMWNIRNPKSD